MVPREIIETASRTLAAVAADPVKIVLFGSRARGDAGPDSDFDFLVVERDPPDRHAEMVRLGRALRPLGMPFDVVVVSERYAEDWGSVEGSMVHAALTEGRVLVEENEIEAPNELAEADVLSPWAVEFRYEGDEPPALDRSAALALVGQVRTWAENEVKAVDRPPQPHQEQPQ